MNSNSDSERQTEFEIIIQMGNSCWGPKVRVIVVVYSDMNKASVKSCRKISKNGSGLWRNLEEANSYLRLLYHR